MKSTGQKSGYRNYIMTYGHPPKPKPKLTPDVKDWLTDAKENGVVTIKLKYVTPKDVEAQLWFNEGKPEQLTEDQRRLFVIFIGDFLQQFVAGNYKNIKKLMV